MYHKLQKYTSITALVHGTRWHMFLQLTAQVHADEYITQLQNTKVDYSRRRNSRLWFS